MGELMDVQFTQDFEDDIEIQSIPIPKFSRIREVTIEEDGTMLCDCCRFEMTLCFCEQQVSVAKMCHECAGDEFKGFTHHDMGVCYWSSYMHLAYKPSTPKHIKQMFHKLAGDGIRGPKLRIPIPDSLPIKEKLPILPAIDRLKNYKKSDINLELFEQMVSQTYRPPANLDEDAEYDLFDEQIKSFNASTSEACESAFDTLLNDSDLPALAKGGVRTRDLLKQQWEEACDMADTMGEEATKEPEECVSAFRTYCNIVSRGECPRVETGEFGRRKYVPMTQGKYQGNQERVYNTHHMYRSK